MLEITKQSLQTKSQDELLEIINLLSNALVLSTSTLKTASKSGNIAAKVILNGNEHALKCALYGYPDGATAP